MERGRDPLSRTVTALCHLQLCLQGSMLATSKESAVTGGKSKSRNMLLFSLILFLFPSSPHPILPDLLFFLSSPFRSHLFLYSFCVVCRCHRTGIHCAGAGLGLTCVDHMHLSRAQLDAPEGMGRAKYVGFPKFHVAVLEMQKDSIY